MNKQQQIIFALLPFVLISFLRFGVGADYLSYENIYNKTDIYNIKQSLNRFPKVEYLYLFLSMFAKGIGIHYHIFISTLNVYIAYLTILWINKNSPKFFLSVLLYYSMFFLFWNLSAVRQGLSMAIMFYFFFNNEKEYSIWKLALVTLISMQIHLSSLIIVVIYFVSLLEWNRKRFLIVFFSAPFLRSLFKPEYFEFVRNIPVFYKLVGYLNQDPISLFDFTTLVRVLFFFVIFIHYDELVNKYNKQKHLINFSILSLVLYLFVPVSKVIATRVTIYGYFLTLIIFVMIVTLYSKKQFRLTVLSGVLLFSVFSMYNELEKAKDRSGYQYSISRLNFETVFEQNRTSFNSYRALESHLYQETLQFYNNDLKVKSILEKGSMIEANYDAKLGNVMVRFATNGKYGIINERGEVVYSPTFEKRGLVFKNYVIFKEKNRQVVYDFVEDKEIPYPMSSAIYIEYIMKLQERSSAIVYDRFYMVNYLFENEFIKTYNLNSIREINMVDDTYYPSIKYLHLKTDMYNYYLLVNNKNELVVDRWYTNYKPYGINNIIEADTYFYKEYINSKGDIIWLESK